MFRLHQAPAAALARFAQDPVAVVYRAEAFFALHRDYMGPIHILEQGKAVLALAYYSLN